MARPLRFRYAPGSWTRARVESDIYRPLDSNLGATMDGPWFKPPSGYEAVRFDMDDGSLALFCWTDDDEGPEGADGGGPAAYWLGNTETPSSLWRTDKYAFEAAPYPVRRWAEKELLAGLHEEEPWLADYPHVSWYFLTVFCSKDGAGTTRRFFRDHASGFPDATRDDALAFYEEFLSTGVLDDYREEMAGKLGTSEYFDETRMTATMGEFDVARLLTLADYDIVPEIEVTTDHVIDYRAERPDGTSTLVEVTRPVAPNRRSTSNPAAAVRDTVETKTSGQLEAHGGGITLFVDCSSFPDDDWAAVRGERPDVGHRPAVVFRSRPDGRTEAYSKGSVPLELDDALEWV
ncbi:hypothetical protein HUG10_12735 [Halorarum halophilum]|uniref:Uncharacterized protein n=1 Tax=Halorarum halophilum TaxID=2743090 RepID=A0A7D5K8L2_9EURY|nr:DUF5784 family protein [Halobaculum halophilum]QLG28359.1 hypothetical protein HUG10_12735 [Halobaculum halophilum]